jgi:FkbM family methyltransferase
MEGFIKPLVEEPAKHIYRLVTDPDYFHYALLGAKLVLSRRLRPRHIRLHGWKLHIPDSKSFLSSYKEIFVNKNYKFAGHYKKPVIIDLGANIGLSVLFFKRTYPNAQIIALEPDPEIFSYLKKNILNNGYGDVELIQAAVWDETTYLDFYADGADGGRITKADNVQPVRVRTIAIADLLKDKDITFLKMDIEGAESTVLPASAMFLPRVEYIFVEFHSTHKKEQNLDVVISTLSNAGFRLHIHSVQSSPQPYITQKIRSGYDLQLNIFGWRE